MGRAILAISESAAAYLPRPLAGAKAAIVAFCRGLARTMFTTYHPERHYMRGPGPAWQAKHGKPQQ